MTTPSDAAREAARRRNGQFGERERSEAAGVDLGGPPPLSGLPVPVRPPQPGVPPDIGTTLVSPVTCRKCGGDGTYTRASGMPDICAPCGGSGQTEGDKAARAARKARADFRTAFMRHLYDTSHNAAQAANLLDANEPERFERAMSAWAAGRDDLIPALETYLRERRHAAEPLERLRWLTKQWDPESRFDGPFDTREAAFDMCKDASAAYTDYINNLGEPHLRAEWIQVVGMKHERPDADARWLEVPRDQWQHYATRVIITNPDDPTDEPRIEIVDWTLRQFDPKASYPFSGSERLYGNLFETTYDLPDRAVEWSLANPVHPERVR